MKIIIIGGGIGGYAAALALSTYADIHIYEKAKSFQPLGTGIGIGSNALDALMKIGIYDAVYSVGMPLHTQLFFDEQGKKLNSIDYHAIKNQHGQENITIHRGKLHEILYDHIPKESISFRKRLIHVEQEKDHVKAIFEDGETVEGDLLIAAGGIHSTIRQTLVPDSQPRYAGYTCWRGMTENNGLIPSHTSCEIWSPIGRVGFAPMHNNQMYWFACIEAPAKSSYFKQLTQRELAYYFRNFPPHIAKMIQETKDQAFLHHDIYDITPLSRFVFNRVVLIGDAAHATTPNMGQGAGQAIEDAVTLANLLKRMDTEDALSQYEIERVAHTRKVIQVSRRIGWASQWSTPVACRARNAVFPFVPSCLLAWRLKFLMERHID